MFSASFGVGKGHGGEVDAKAGPSQAEVDHLTQLGSDQPSRRICALFSMLQCHVLVLLLFARSSSAKVVHITADSMKVDT